MSLVFPYDMSHVARKPVSRICGQVSLKPFCWATEGSRSLDSIGMAVAAIGIIRASSRENLSSGFSTRYDSNRPAKQQKLARSLNFRIYKKEVLYYLGSEQQRCWSDCADAQADLHLCCLHMAKTGFLMTWLILSRQWITNAWSDWVDEQADLHLCCLHIWHDQVLSWCGSYFESCEQ